MRIEETILSALVFVDGYSRKVLPFICEEYFQSQQDRLIFKIINTFVNKYNALPTEEAIGISLNEIKQSAPENEKCKALIEIIFAKKEQPDEEWLIDKTEKFCKEKAVYNAILESIHIIDGTDKKHTESAIPKILSDALAVSFDTHIGHDYIEDSSNRFLFYHKKEKKIPFDLEIMNKITSGGLSPKTLNIVMAGTGVGKSLFMCHHAASCLLKNYNVLYITCEMSEERIAERVDANIMDIVLDDLRSLPKEVYDRKLRDATIGVHGKLIVKEYPTATANANHFRHLLDELKLKKKFVPDIIFIDYLNICTSARMKNSENSYQFVKAIAEELRGLAVEYELPIVSATQTNRQGFSNTDVGLDNTSESFGLPATADFMFAIITTDELEENGQLLFKQLKNRYNDISHYRKFIVGVEKAKMKFSDVSSFEQENILGTDNEDEQKKGDYDSKFKEWNIA